MQFVQELSKIQPDSTFLSLKNYRNSANEVADYQIVFHASYANSLKKSLNILQDYVPSNDIESQAKSELIQSFSKSLDKIASDDYDSDVYDQVLDADGNHIKGVKIHKESETLYIFGLLRQKIVYVRGIYKPVNKQALTIAKDKLKSLCPVNNWRQFIIKPGQVECLKVERLTIQP